MAREPIRGRGASDDPPNRFHTLSVEREEWTQDEDPAPRTEFLRDASRSIIAWNDSPDLGFDAGINPYRGCEHGCIYCYARPYHEYLGFSAGLDFETRIMVKEDAPELLRRQLASPRWKPQTLLMSGVTDPYQPVERRLRLTRRCLQVLAEFRNPVALVTKNHRVTRDLDVLGELARHDAVAVTISLTTLDRGLQRVMEPRTSIPTRRLDAIDRLASAGVPVGVNLAPVIPGLTDRELPGLLRSAAVAGASFAGYIMLRLPLGVAPLFESWLEQHRPGAKAKVLSRIREMRGGRLNDARFGSRGSGEGAYAEQMRQLFHVTCRRLGLGPRPVSLSTAAFRRPAGGRQLGLFSG
jgi:DNA repair photolyase